MPGVLPVLNKKALEFSIRTGLALNCSISPTAGLRGRIILS